MEEIHNDFGNWKMWDEMTPDERERSFIEIWKHTQPDEGGPVSVSKHFPLDAGAVRTTVRTLAALRDAIASDAEAHGFHNEWEHMEASYLFKLLDLRMKSDAGLI